MCQSRGDDILERKTCFGWRTWLLVTRYVEGWLVSGDLHTLDVPRIDAHLILQRERAVDGRERMAAAGVVLERHARDVEVVPQSG
jgi:hypothetical protein